jgi:hypothetical protein
MIEMSPTVMMLRSTMTSPAMEMMKSETLWVIPKKPQPIAIMLPVMHHVCHIETTTILVQTTQPNPHHYPLPLACAASALKAR